MYKFSTLFLQLLTHSPFYNAIVHSKLHYREISAIIAYLLLEWEILINVVHLFLKVMHYAPYQEYIYLFLTIWHYYAQYHGSGRISIREKVEWFHLDPKFYVLCLLRNEHNLSDYLSPPPLLCHTLMQRSCRTGIKRNLPTYINH